MFLLIANAAHATKPCQLASKEWFIDNVVKKSDAVIYGKILDYSNSSDQEQQFTKIQVVKSIYGETESEIAIKHWQSYYEPLYIDNKGDSLLLWLKQEDNQYYITDIHWGYCIPSIWYADNNEATPKWSVNNDMQTISDLSFDAISLIIANAKSQRN